MTQEREFVKLYSVRTQAKPNRRCFACGRENPRGLQIQFSPDGAGHVVAKWKTSPDLESFHGVVHGGILSTVLDEAMAKAIVASGWPALTCDLQVRFHRHVAAGETLLIRGWIVEKRKRRIRAEATLCDLNGKERAHGWATFLSLVVACHVTGDASSS